MHVPGQMDQIEDLDLPKMYHRVFKRFFREVMLVRVMLVRDAVESGKKK